jgi:acetyl esterase
MREKAAGWGLDVEAIRFFNSQWVPDRARWSDPGVSPLSAPDLSGLPAALIVTAEHDPLRDESEAYARRLRDAGVAVELRREPGQIHSIVVRISLLIHGATGWVLGDGIGGWACAVPAAR